MKFGTTVAPNERSALTNFWAPVTLEVSWRGHKRSRDFADLEVFLGGLLILKLQKDHVTGVIRQINHRAHE